MEDVSSFSSITRNFIQEISATTFIKAEGFLELRVSTETELQHIRVHSLESLMSVYVCARAYPCCEVGGCGEGVGTSASSSRSCFTHEPRSKRVSTSAQRGAVLALTRRRDQIQTGPDRIAQSIIQVSQRPLNARTCAHTHCFGLHAACSLDPFTSQNGTSKNVSGPLCI